MKKLYTTEKYKKWNKYRSRKRLDKRVFLNNKKRLRRATNKSKYSKKNKEENNLESLRKGYVLVYAPKILSFIDNSEGVVNFIDQLKQNYDKQNKVWVVLEEVEVVTYDAIVVLLSIMVKFKTGKIDFNGDYPKNRNAKKIIYESNFINLLFQDFDKADRYNLGKKSSIVTHAYKEVDSELGGELIKQASKTVWEEERRCQGVQRTLIELMLNTNNHADKLKKGEKHWWLSVHHDNEMNKVSFAFIDFGVGVFTSLDNKPKKNKFYGVMNLLRNEKNYKNDAELLRLILDGTLHKTATNKPYHGKGLPGINSTLKRNQLSNLNIITNNVHAKVDENEFNLISKSFSGTFVYWELNKNNVSSNGINQDKNSN